MLPILDLDYSSSVFNSSINLEYFVCSEDEFYSLSYDTMS